MVLVAIVTGLATGVISGLIGLGGGIFIVPALVFVFKMSQHEALLRRVFAITLVVVAVRMWFER